MPESMLLKGSREAPEGPGAVWREEALRPKDWQLLKLKIKLGDKWGGGGCQSEHMEDLLRCVPRGLVYTPLFLLRSLLPSLPLTCPASLPLYGISPIDFLTSSGFLD